MPDESSSGDVLNCLQCGTLISSVEDAITTDEGPFCKPCFSRLEYQIEGAVRQQSMDINYPAAAIGATLGGMVGAAIWWGFTVITNISFGLVAVVIGFGVGKGIQVFTGGKRARGLQGLAVAASTLAFFYASYLVNRTRILKYIREEEGVDVSLPFLPDLDTMVEVIQVSFGLFDVFFLAIVVYQAWRMPAPFKISFREG